MENLPDRPWRVYVADPFDSGEPVLRLCERSREDAELGADLLAIDGYEVLAIVHADALSALLELRERETLLLLDLPTAEDEAAEVADGDDDYPL